MLPVIIFSLLCSVALYQKTFAIITTPDLSEYGVDVSYPIHHYLDGKGEPNSQLKLADSYSCKFQLLSQLVSPYFKSHYEKLMDGCYKYYSKRECDATERARLEMSLSQPKTQHNYTKVGFQKTRVPKGNLKDLFIM